MGTFNTNQPLLSTLLKEIRSCAIQLPDFQRDWIWDDEHIRSLIASVTLSHPIGAIMTLQTGGEGSFLPRPFEGVDNPSPPIKPEILVLDGQQRLTSLYRALESKTAVPTKDTKGREIERFYYLDMAKCLDRQAEREEAVVSVPESKTITSDFGRRIVKDLRTNQGEYGNRLFPLNIVFDVIESGRWKNEYHKHFRYDQKQAEFLVEFDKYIYFPLQKYNLPVIELQKATPKAAVCQVFEKVNTGGVDLSVFELVTASFAADGFRLRDDWRDRRDRLRESSDILRYHGAADGSTEFLQAVTLLVSYRRSRDGKGVVGVRKRDVLRLKYNEYEDNADLVEEGFRRAANLLCQESVFRRRDLPYGAQLVPLAAVCAYLEERFDEASIRTKLARWYWCGVFGEMYGSANETRYAMDIEDLLGWTIYGNGEPRTVGDANLSPMRLLGLKTRNSAAYKGIFALMVRQGSRDFKSGAPIANSMGFVLPVDIHHIFPRAWCRRSNHTPGWNSVLNKAPLTSATNRMIGGRAPSKYVAGLVDKGYIGQVELDSVLATHWIAPQFLRDDNYMGFLRDRAVKLLDAIAKVMGKPVQGRDSEEVVEKFGGSLRNSGHRVAAPPPSPHALDFAVGVHE